METATERVLYLTRRCRASKSGMQFKCSIFLALQRKQENIWRDAGVRRHRRRLLLFDSSFFVFLIVGAAKIGGCSLLPAGAGRRRTGDRIAACNSQDFQVLRIILFFFDRPASAGYKDRGISQMDDNLGDLQAREGVQNPGCGDVIRPIQ